jgi:hypothetical protein
LEEGGFIAQSIASDRIEGIEGIFRAAVLGRAAVPDRSDIKPSILKEDQE